MDTAALWTIIILAILVVTLALSQVILFHRLASRQMSSLMQDMKSLESELGRQMTLVIPTLMASMEKTENQTSRTLLNELVRPLLAHQEILVNRLLSKDPLASQVLDSSLASRMPQPPQEYVLHTDTAEAEQVARLLGESNELINQMPGWDSLSEGG